MHSILNPTQMGNCRAKTNRLALNPVKYIPRRSVLALPRFIARSNRLCCSHLHQRLWVVSPMFDYQLIRSKRRKTLAIKVSAQGVEVRAPSWTSTAEVSRFVAHKRSWIEHHLQRFASLPDRQALEKHYIEGERFQYLGQHYSLQIRPGKRHAVALKDDYLQVTLNQRQQTASPAQVVKRQLEHWYRQQALAWLTPLSHQLAAQVARKVESVKVRRTRSKWGHCTSKGDLQYNWLIMAAPPAVIHYLVAHEVSHLVHHNHSPAFWQQVGQLCPDWQQQRDWLKAHGYQLQV